MNWVLEHLQILLAGAGAIAYWLNQRKGVKREDEEAAGQSAQPSTMAEADDDDRGRKIREEIMRKISSRRGEEPPSSTSTATPVGERTYSFPPLTRPPVTPLDTFGGPARPRALRQEPAPPPPIFVRTESDAAVLARQEQLQEQMRDLEAQRATALRRATVVATASRVADEVSARAASAVRSGLRDPRALRHAVILREVLGTPVGLR